MVQRKLGLEWVEFPTYGNPCWRRVSRRNGSNCINIAEKMETIFSLEDSVPGDW
jgi:hypothetical protein